MSLFSKAPKKAATASGATDEAPVEAPVRKTRTRSSSKAAPDLLSEAGGEGATASQGEQGQELVQPAASSDQSPSAAAGDSAGEAAPISAAEEAPQPADAPAGEPAAKMPGEARPVAPKKPKLIGKAKLEHERQQHRAIAKSQRQRNKELIKEFLPNQRGAVMLVRIKIGSREVEGWFKRKYVRAARQLYRIHTFPLTNISPEVIQRLEREILNAIAMTESKLSKEIAQYEKLLSSVSAPPAVYQNWYELEMPVSTKAAMNLCSVFQKADELHRLVQNADLVGLLDDKTLKKAIGRIHGAIFGLDETVDRFHSGLYIRVQQATPDSAEVDSSAAVAAGGPIDRVEDAPAGAVPPPPPMSAPAHAVAAAAD